MSDRTERRGGRPSKGDRHRLSVRVPLAIADGLPTAAAEAGYDNVNDWLVDLAAVAQGQPPAYGTAEQLLSQLDAGAAAITRKGQLSISA